MSRDWCSSSFHEITLCLSQLNIGIISQQVNKCDEPVTVTASMDVLDLGVTWSHTYTSDIIEVPGFTVSLPSIFSAGVYVQVGLTDNGDRLHLKVVTVISLANSS